MADFDIGHIKKALGTVMQRAVGFFLKSDGDPESASADDGAEEFDIENWSHFGFESRVHPEDDLGRCEILFDRSQQMILATRDRRFRINLKDGEVAVYTGEKGKITCKQVMKPDGTVVTTSKNVGMLVKKRKGDGGDVVINADNSITLSQGDSTSSIVTIKDNGGIQAVTAKGQQFTLDPGGKAALNVDGASIVLETLAPSVATVTVNAGTINLNGDVGAGTLPNKLPVATVGCMAGPFPIATGSFHLLAQFP